MVLVVDKKQAVALLEVYGGFFFVLHMISMPFVYVSILVTREHSKWESLVTSMCNTKLKGLFPCGHWCP